MRSQAPYNSNFGWPSLLLLLSFFSTAYILFISSPKRNQLLKNIQKLGRQELRCKGWHTSDFSLLVMLSPNLLVYNIPNLSRDWQMCIWGLPKHKEKLQSLNFKSSFHYNNKDVPMIPGTMGLHLYC